MITDQHARRAEMKQVVLIGPMAAGKSSVAWRLSERTGQRNVPLDQVRWFYFFRAGFDLIEQERRVKEHGSPARLAYWKPFETYAVERVLADFPDAIIDFGAGYTVQDEEGLFARIQAALAPVPHVILLLPSPDLDESLAILTERLPQGMQPEDREEMVCDNRHFLMSPCNAFLAKATVYTGRRPVEEVSEEVLTLIKKDANVDRP
jgi:shikimate kinase